MKRVLGEIAISIALLIVLAGTAVIIFADKIPYNKTIPESINYKNIDQNDYKITGGGVENEVKETATYSSDPRDIKIYELEQRFTAGKIGPFDNVNVDTDIPTEVIINSNTNSSNGEVSESGENGTSIQNKTASESTATDATTKNLEGNI